MHVKSCHLSQTKLADEDEDDDGDEHENEREIRDEYKEDDDEEDGYNNDADDRDDGDVDDDDSFTTLSMLYQTALATGLPIGRRESCLWNQQSPAIENTSNLKSITLVGDIN